MAMFDRNQLFNSQGVARTKSLFVEFGASSDNILTLGENRAYPSLKSLYVNLTVDDPSEATFIDVVFGDFQFWTKLSSTTWMKEHLKAWRHEAEVKRKSKAFKCIVGEIENEGRNAYQAAKYLIEEPWKGKAKPVREASKKSTAEALPSHITDLTEYLKTKK